MIENPKIGQKVWMMEPEFNVMVKGKLKKIKHPTKQSKEAAIVTVKTKEFGLLSCSLKNLYPTKMLCLKDQRQKEEQLKASYRKQIQTKDDLIQFCLKHPCTICGDTDWIARKVALEKVAEFNKKK